MIFDKVCKVVEANKEAAPALYAAINEARLFVADEEDVNKNWNIRPATTEQCELFALPFPVCCLEMSGMVICVTHPRDPESLGMKERRTFVILKPMPKETIEYALSHFDSTNDKQLRRAKASMLFLEGEVYVKNYVLGKDPDVPTGFNLAMENMMAGIATDTGVLNGDDASKFMDQEQLQRMGRKVQQALSLFLVMSLPKLFVLENSPARPPKVSKDRLARSHQRPQYTVLRPNAIRKKLGLRKPGTGAGTGQARSPHERCAHPRRLRKSSGYREDRVVWVKASWIGPSEAHIGNRIYRVILDPGPAIP